MNELLKRTRVSDLPLKIDLGNDISISIHEGYKARIRALVFNYPNRCTLASLNRDEYISVNEVESEEEINCNILSSYVGGCKWMDKSYKTMIVLAYHEFNDSFTCNMYIVK